MYLENMLTSRACTFHSISINLSHHFDTFFRTQKGKCLKKLSQKSTFLTKASTLPDYFCWLWNESSICPCFTAAVQQKMSEETGARIRAEGRVVEVEKQCSMLEFDLKQSVQKMEQLMKQKERLEDEVSKRLIYVGVLM